MKNHIIFKFLAIALCALALLSAVVSGVSLVGLASLGINQNQTPETVRDSRLMSDLENMAVNAAYMYAAEHLGNCPEALVRDSSYYGYGYSGYAFPNGDVFYTLTDANGTVLKSNVPDRDDLAQWTLPNRRITYPLVVAGPVQASSEFEARAILAQQIRSQQPTEEAIPAPAAEPRDAAAIAEEDIPKDTVIQIPAGSNVTIIMDPEQSELNQIGSQEWVDQVLAETLGKGVRVYEVYSDYSGEWEFYFCRQETSENFQVTVHTAPNAWRHTNSWELIRVLYAHQTLLMQVLGVSIFLFAVLAVYLCTAAGRKPGSGEVQPAGLNRMPLDVYMSLSAGGIALGIVLIVGSFEALLWHQLSLALYVTAIGGYLCCLLFVGFCFAAAAQFKTPGLYWWRHSLCGFVLRHAVRLWKWFWGWIPGAFRLSLGLIRDVCRALFAMGMTAAVWLLNRGLRLWKILWNWIRSLLNRVWQLASRMFGLLPLTWQWLLAGFVMIFILALSVNSYRAERVVMGIGLCVAMVLYGATAFGTLLEATRRMRSGDLEAKVEDRMLVGAFRDFSGELNGLADVAVVAAQKQLKSERMKTELITNVSHDIKTPLTSIINYVDLLQKPHTPEEETAYLEVLSRQSQRMKKLIDDLMEMSKASTGNLPVEMEQVNAAEAVNQALGEFTDKLTAAQLSVVYQQPEEPIFIYADGRLVWRAMSNLLSNAVKYAMAGTRIYVDLERSNGKVLISLKNISREQLNIPAEELMERFVRGDVSRNTEGSGLGLNIARSVMELQRGSLDLLVDGDLFKVTLTFLEGNPK